jgi:hypothetical protein
MVGKRKRIAKRPSARSTAEDWVQEGGIDPELQSSDPPADPAADENTQADKSKTYPHRISFDVETAQYKRLKWAAFDCDRSMNDILREAAEEWLKARKY